MPERKTECSDHPLPLETLKQADADVKIHAAQVLLPHVPLNSLDMDMVLKDGALTVKPLKAVSWKGFHGWPILSPIPGESRIIGNGLQNQ